MKEELITLQQVFRDVFEDNQLEINEQTTAKDIDEWDSLNHIYLVVEIEKAFSVKFNTLEIMEWQNVGDMLTSIEKHK